MLLFSIPPADLVKYLLPHSNLNALCLMSVKPGLVLLLALTGMQMQSVKSMKTAKEGFVEGKIVLLMLTVASMSARIMCVLLKGKVSSP